MHGIEFRRDVQFAYSYDRSLPQPFFRWTLDFRIVYAEGLVAQDSQATAGALHVGEA